MNRKLSDDDIGFIAHKLRSFLSYSDSARVDMCELLDRLKESKRLNIVLASDDELPHAYAETHFESRTVRIRESVFVRAKAGDPRAQFTLAEEVGHLVLRHEGVRNRMIGTDTRAKGRADVASQEQEARRFAATLLAPLSGSVTCSNAREIQEKYGLSRAAAMIRFDEVQKAIRRQSGTLRALPNIALEYLQDAEKNGYRIKYADLSAAGSNDINAQDPEARNRAEAVARGYEAEPCIDCGNYTLCRRGPDTTCESCGRPCGC